MTKSMSIIGFITCFVFSTGVAFELFHWPYSGIIMFSGFLMLNLVLMPLFFYHKYKSHPLS